MRPFQTFLSVVSSLSMKACLKVGTQGLGAAGESRVVRMPAGWRDDAPARRRAARPIAALAHQAGDRLLRNLGLGIPF